MKSKTHLLFAIYLFLVVPGFLAQVSPEKEPPVPIPGSCNKTGPASKVLGVDPGNMPTWANLNFKLQVKLGNNRTIVGIARNGKLFEKVVLQGKISKYEKSLKQRFGINPSASLSQRFIVAKPTDGNVGIRLWHHDSTGGYIFLLYKDIVSVKRLKVITPAELKELDERTRRKRAAGKDEIQKKWEAHCKKRRDALKKRLAARKKGSSEQAPKDQKNEEKLVGDQELADLFKRFHPSKGWTPGRKRIIEWRKWSLGIFPNEEEKEFLARFQSWKKAYDKWVTATTMKKKSEEEKKGNEEPSPDRPAQEAPDSVRPDPNR